MSMLLRFDPFRELDRWSEATRNPATQSPAIPMDAVRKGDHVEVRFDLPGFDPASVELEVERNVLSLKAERKWQAGEDEQVLASERRHGTYSRQLFLGDNLDGGRVEAIYRDGVLSVTIPVAETAKPKKVAISSSTNGAPQPIDAESTAN